MVGNRTDDQTPESSNMVTAGYPAMLGKTSLPNLTDKVDLPHHLVLVESCLVEAGYAVIVEETKTVQILAKFKHLAISKIIGSLEAVKDVHSSASRAALMFDYQWPQIRRVLTQQYCKKTSLKAEYQAKLQSLIFKSNSECEAFIEIATEAFSLNRRAFGTDKAERRSFIRSLCKRIPHDTVLQSLRMLQTAIVAAGFDDADTDWETAVAFDDFDLASRSEDDQPLVSSITFCSALRSVCNVADEAQQLAAAPTVASTYTRERVHYVHPAADSSRRPKFSERFAHVMFVFGSMLEDRDKAQRYFDTLKPVETLLLRGRKGRPYALLGFSAESDFANALSDVQKDTGSVDGGAHADSDDSLLPILPAPKGELPVVGVATATDSGSQQVGPRGPVWGSEDATPSRDNHEEFFSPLGATTTISADTDHVHNVRPGQATLPELTLDICIANKLDITAVVDSGAGGSYLLCSSVVALLAAWDVNGQLSTVAHTVKLADGKVRTVNQCLALPLLVRDIDSRPAIECTVSFRVLESVTSQPFLLIGRDLIQAWDLRLFGASRVTTSTGCVLFTSSPVDRLALSTEFVYDVNNLLAVEDAIGGVTPSASVAVQPDPSVIAFEVHLETHIAEALRVWLANLARDSKREFGTAESGAYGIQLLPLPHGCPKDTTLQTHYFELSIPEPRGAIVKHRPYARPLYLRLSDQYKQVYKDLVKGYLTRGWWEALGPDSSRIGDLLPAEIFLLGAKPGDVRKPRLVADFSPCNSQLPVSTTSGIAVGDVLLALRCVSPAFIVGYDCASAFYRIRLEPKRLLYMHSGMTDSNDPDFVSTRLSFGFGAGPMSMEESLGWLVARFRISPFAAFLLLVAIFVDDGVLAGADPRVLEAAKYLFFLLDLCGFACALAKLHLIAVDPLLVPDAFLTLQKDMLLLGCTLSYVDGCLLFNCGREVRLQPARTVCEEWLREGSHAKVTKRLVFRVGGAFGYDPLSLHATASLVGDCLRRLVGRAFSQFGWDAPLPLVKFSPVLLDAWRALLRWGIKECDLAICDHGIPVLLPDQTKIRLALYTDASFVGGGYVVYRLDSKASDDAAGPYLLTQAAFGWKGTQYSWHSNRRELTVLLRGLRCVVNLVRNVINMSPSKSLAIELDIYSDNKPSVSWAQKAQGAFPQGIGRSTSVEKRSVMRLIDALAEEFRVLRGLGSAVSYSIRHCAGPDNAAADELSRYLEQSCDDSGKNTFASVLQDFPAVDLDNPEIIADAAREADRLASDTAYVLRLADFDPDPAENTDCCDYDGLFLLSAEDDDLDDLLPYATQRAFCHPVAVASLLDCSLYNSILTVESCRSDDFAQDCLFSVNDQAEESEPLYTALLRHNDINYVYRSVAVLRAVLGFWRSQVSYKARYPRRNAPGRQGSVDPAEAQYAKDMLVLQQDSVQRLDSPGFQLADVLVVVRLAQADVTFSGRGTAYVYDPKDNVWCFRAGTLAGEVLIRPCIPREARRLRFLLALDAHHRVGHSGPTATLSAVSADLHVAGISSDVKQVSRRCLFCAKLRVRASALARHAPAAGASWDFEKLLLTGTPYTVCAIDFLHVFPNEIVLAARCIATTHTTWLPVSHGAECTDAAIEGVKWLLNKWGHINTVYVDCGTAFTSGAFQDQMAEWAVRVEYHASRAPWETPVERSHAIGLRTLRSCYTPQKLARASPYDLCKIYDHVTLLMNTSPICEHVLDHQSASSSSTFITADALAFGYTRSTGILVKSVDGNPIPDLHAARPVAIQNIRKAFLSHHWQALRDRSAQQLGRQPSKHTQPLTPGSTVLIRYRPRNKCDVGVHVGHIVAADVSPDGFCRRYRVRSTSGNESTENHCNIVPLLSHAAEDCVLTRGACCRK